MLTKRTGTHMCECLSYILISEYRLSSVLYKFYISRLFIQALHCREDEYISFITLHILLYPLIYAIFDFVVLP